MGRLQNNSIFALALLALLGACSNNDDSSYHACYDTFTCTSDGSIVKWHLPVVTFNLDPNLPQQYVDAETAAIADYNSLLDPDIQVALAPASDTPPAYNGDPSAMNNNGVNAIYYVTGTWPWAESIPNSLAVTLTRYVDDGIMQADTFIKADAIDPTVVTNPASLAYWTEYLVAHEMGHALGRAHTKNQASLMFATIPFESDLSYVPAPMAEPKDFFTTYDTQQLLTPY